MILFDIRASFVDALNRQIQHLRETPVSRMEMDPATADYNVEMFGTHRTNRNLSSHCDLERNNIQKWKLFSVFLELHDMHYIFFNLYSASIKFKSFHTNGLPYVVDEMCSHLFWVNIRNAQQQ